MGLGRGGLMRYRLLAHAGARTYAVVPDEGEEVVACLTRLARAERLRASRVQAVGGFCAATVAFLDCESKQYSPIPVDGQLEVLSFLGDITSHPDDDVKVHVHVVLGHPDGSTVGGHLLEGVERPTCEVVITESPTHVARHHDPASGLALIGGDDDDPRWRHLDDGV